MALLSASDISTLRGPDWVADEIDSHTEWGAVGSANVKTAAAAGASTLALQGLATTGTLTARTTFAVVSGSTREEYQLAADATIAAGSATVSLLRPLVYAARVSDRVEVRAFKRSSYNRQTSEEFFADADLEAFATRAEKRWARLFADADDPQSTRYLAITCLALQAMRDSTRYVDSVYEQKGNDNGRDYFARLQARIDGMLSRLNRDVTGPTYEGLTR